MKRLLILLLALSFSGAVFATPMSWVVTVDTTSITGLNGYLDTWLIAGPLDSLAATASISEFGMDGSLGTGTTAGDAAGFLPGSVTLANTPDGFGNYLTDLTYGAWVKFLLTLDGPALAPGTSPGSGSTFSATFYDAGFGTSFFDVFFDINVDGSVTSLGSPGTTIQPTPEPATVGLAGLAIFGMALFRLRKRA